MVYDWTGVRTRRMRKIKLTAASILALVIVSAPVFAFA